MSRRRRHPVGQRTQIRQLGTSVLAALAVACAHSSAPDEDPCVGLASAFHALASNKDLGVSYERQLQMIHDEYREDPSPEGQWYLTGMLRIIYGLPQADAEEIRRRVEEVCSLDSQGRIRMPPEWDPWRRAV